MNFLSPLQRLKIHAWFGPPMQFKNTQKDGIVAFLSSEENPHDIGIVTVSASSTDSASKLQKQDILMKDTYLMDRWFTKTSDDLGYWWMIDFNDTLVEASHYTIMENNRTIYLPTNWTLTGSVDGKQWIELDHQNDPTIFQQFTFQKKTFPISKTKKVRFLKIEHFGKTNGNPNLVLAGFDLHGVLFPRYLKTPIGYQRKRRPLSLALAFGTPFL